MNYELKMTKGSKVVGVFLSLILLALGGVIVYLSVKAKDTVVLIMSAVAIIAVIYTVAFVFSNNAKSLVFNNVNFYLKGRTYTYQQIEKIGIYGGTFGSVAYEVYVDGKKIYSFTMDYEGAKEFMYYLDFYKVPGTPRR